MIIHSNSITKKDNNFELFSVIPQKCDYGCSCFYNSEEDLNVFDCSFRNFTELLTVVPPNTTFLNLSGNRIHTLCKMFYNFKNIQHIDLSHNNISVVKNSFVKVMKDMKNIMYLNLENNAITTLPETITKVTSIKTFKLSRNPYQCNCDMLWMQKWIYKLSTSPELNFIPDYKNITCASELMFGKPVYELDGDAMDCALQWYWIVVLACISVAVFVTTALVLHKNWEKLKFFLFVHFDILTTDDGVENLQEMLYDAFVCYR